METPKTTEVDAVLCGLCTCLRTTIFTILWQAGTIGRVHLMPPTEEQIVRSMEIAGEPWMEECFQDLGAEVNSDVSTPECLVAMGERRKRKPGRQQGGFQKLTTPTKKTEKKTQRKLFTAKPDVGVSDEKSELSTADDESTRSDTPPKDRRRERDDGELKASAQTAQRAGHTATRSYGCAIRYDG